MAPTLRFSSLVLLTASWMLAAGCGDDDTQLIPTGGAGQAGSGAHAGSSGSGAHAGATGGAGKPGNSSAGSSEAGSDTGGAAGEGGEPAIAGGTSGGTAGISGGGTSGGGTSGGTAGTSGGGTGGTAGGGGATAGTSGTAGGGGATAGTSGTAGGGGATAGTGGTAGGGGADNGALKTCAYQCNTDDDCKISTEAQQSHFCNPTSKRCEDLSVCATSSDCVAFASQWYGSCSVDGDCFTGDVCVASAGRGLCATPSDPDPEVGCSAVFGTVPTPATHFGSAVSVEVCGSPDGLCVDRACQYRCDSVLGGCNGTTCNTTTGLCDCSSSGQCTTQATPGKPECGADSHCGCGTSAECTAGGGADKCYSGTCGCSGVAACPASQFNNAPPVCE